MKKIYVSDYTLRKLSEEKQNSFLFREKTSIVSTVEGFGVDAIELDEIKKVKEDTIVYKTISSIVKNAKVCIPTGITETSLENAWECVKDANHPCLQVILPVSTVQMEYLYHMKEEKMLGTISSCITRAKAKCKDVEFVAVDAMRSSTDFLLNACNTAKECGATAITICDSEGTSLPSEIAGTVKSIKESVGLPVYVCLSNAIGLAVACAISAIQSGADGVKITISSNDSLKADALSSFIKARGDSLDITTGLHSEKIVTGIKDITNALPVLSAESKETGLEKISLDSSCTIDDISKSTKELGYDLSEKDLGIILSETHKVCASKGVVGAKEFEAIIASFAMQTPSTYHLENYLLSSSDITGSMARVTLTKDNEEIVGVGTGNGPVDSAFLAIEQCVGHHYELDSFEIDAVTEGKEALGSAIVKLRNQGKLFSGNGVSTDIIGASIRAYLNALNKIVFEEK